MVKRSAVSYQRTRGKRKDAQVEHRDFWSGKMILYDTVMMDTAIIKTYKTMKHKEWTLMETIDFH